MINLQVIHSLRFEYHIQPVLPFFTRLFCRLVACCSRCGASQYGLSCHLESAPITLPIRLSSRVVQVLGMTLQESQRWRRIRTMCQFPGVEAFGAIVPGDGHLKIRALYETYGLNALH